MPTGTESTSRACAALKPFLTRESTPSLPDSTPKRARSELERKGPDELILELTVLAHGRKKAQPKPG